MFPPDGFSAMLAGVSPTVPKMKKLNLIAAGVLVSLANVMAEDVPLFSQHENQVHVLLAQMTLDEKIGQMVQVDSAALKSKADVQKYFLGSVLSGGNSVPPTGNT